MRYVLKFVDNNGDVSKSLWTFIKDRRTDHCGVASLGVNGTIYNKCKDKASFLNEYFATVFTKKDSSDVPFLDDYLFPDISPIGITNDGIFALLLNLKFHKASGPDGIPASLLKNLAKTLAPPLTIIFRASLSQSTIPSQWKIANIVPIFKKGNRSNPGNYRPVSLTCIYSKLLEHIIYWHIFSHLTKHNILTEEQYGFRQYRSFRKFNRQSTWELQSIIIYISWSDHITNISNKANSVVGFLHCNFNQCPTKTKSALYLSLVRPILEYAATVWEPHYHTDIYQLEIVQRRAARFAMNCYNYHQSVTEMLHSLEWPTLVKRRNHSKIIMMYKIVYKIVHNYTARYINNLFQCS